MARAPHIVKRGKGWQARFWYTDEFGKRHSPSKSGFRTKSLARAWYVEQKALVDKGTNVDKKISLSDYFADWVATYKEPKQRAQTRRSVTGYIPHHRKTTS